ncbi:MAG: hypothetical protein ACT4QC_23910 [Planctomycetaceae bacterium]
MAWNGIIFRAPAGISVSDLPSDFQMSTLGTTDELGQQMRALFPQSEHNRGYCHIEGDDFWLELSFDNADGQDTHESVGVRSNAGLGVIPVLQRVCDALGARLLDIQMGEFADLEGDTQSSMLKFSAWRDRVIDEAKQDRDPG